MEKKSLTMINRISNQLKYPPLKYIKREIPDKLFLFKKADFGNINDVVMFSTKPPFGEARMSYFKSESRDSIGITMLLSFPRKQGLGTEMLRLASKISQQEGFEGRFFLVADPSFTPNEAPHLFYRKFGMNTGNKNIDKKMDAFIKKGKQGTYVDFPREFMYYPPIPYQQEKNGISIYKKLKNTIMEYINTLL